MSNNTIQAVVLVLGLLVSSIWAQTPPNKNQTQLDNSQPSQTENSEVKTETKTTEPAENQINTDNSQKNGETKKTIAQTDSKARAQDVFNYLKEMDVVYIASKKKQNIEKAPGIVSVYTRRQIRELGFKNMADLLRTVPGLFVAHTAEKYAAVRSRGINNSLLFLLDGIPMIQNFRVEALKRFPIPINNIDRVEILRGPGGVTWGANAFLGIVNIVTKDIKSLCTTEKKWGGEVNATRGSWETNQVGFQLYSCLGHNVSMAVSGSYYESKGYIQDTLWNKTLTGGWKLYQDPGALYATTQSKAAFLKPDPADRRNQDKLSDLMLKLNWRLTKDSQVGLTYYRNGNKQYSILSRWGAQKNRNNADYFEFPFNFYKIDFQHLLLKGVALEFSVSRRESIWWEHVTATGGPDYTTSSLSDVDTDKGTPNNNGQFYYQFNFNDPSISHTAETLAKIDLIPRNSLLLGVSWFHQEQTTVFSSSNNTDTNLNLSRDRYIAFYDQGPNSTSVSSVFAQDDITILQNMLWLQAGLRYDGHQDFENIFNPKGSIIYKPFEMLIAKGLYGRGFREAQFANLFSTVSKLGSKAFAGINPSNDPNAPGAPPELNPELSESFEGQLTISPLKQIKINTNLAFTRVTGLIQKFYETDITYDPEPWQYFKNSGEQEVLTAEIEIHYRIAQRFFVILPGTYGYLNYTYNQIDQIVSTSDVTIADNARSTNSTVPVYSTSQVLSKPARHVGNAGGFIKLLPFMGLNFHIFYSHEREEVRFQGIEPGLTTAYNGNTNYSYMVPSYFLFDAGLSFMFVPRENQKLTISFQVKNLADNSYQEPVHGDGTGTSGSEFVPNPQPGRYFALSLFYEF